MVKTMNPRGNDELEEDCPRSGEGRSGRKEGVFPGDTTGPLMGGGHLFAAWPSTGCAG